MNRELLGKAIAHISSPNVELGVKRLLNKDGSPCDALGHMAFVAGMDLAPTKNESDYYLQIRKTYGYDVLWSFRIWHANDGSLPENRKEKVVAVLRNMLNLDGRNPIPH